MKKYSSIFFLFTTLLLLWSCPSRAENLLQVYEQALRSDPQFKAAEAQWLAATQLSPISRAALLPSLLTSGNVSKSQINETVGGITENFTQDSQQYSLNLNQPLFNYTAWALLQNANAQVKQAEATYNAARQDLMSRVVTTYFAVIEAYETLLATQAQKASLGQQLKQTQEQFKVGLIAITGVEQVKASYDATLADEIANENSIADNLEQLRAITGVFYKRLEGVSYLPLVKPNPQNINAWVKVAAKQNYTLRSAYYAMIASRENIKVQAGGHFPTVNATGSYSYQHQSATDFFGSTLTPATIKTGTVGIGVNLPVYQGGLVTAEVRQASYQYAQASAQMEESYRSTLAQTRISYLGVIAGISKIQADRTAISSNQSSLDATKAAYTVGTSTIVDVLQQQTFLYTAQTNYATDQFNYITSQVDLKVAAGILCDKDIALINRWLGKSIDFSAYDFDNKQVSFES